MDFKFNAEPVPHIIIDNFFTADELKDIWTELDFLTYSRKLLPPEKTASDTVLDHHGNLVFKKNNMGVFLDAIYSNRDISNILFLLQNKIYTPEFMKLCEDQHYLFRYFSSTTMHSTLVSYYESGGHYKSHFDQSVMSMLMWFAKEPQQFTGGDLVLSDYDYTIPFQSNRVIIMPSIIMHSVTEVVMNEGLKPMSGLGRYVVTNFARIR